GARLVQNAGSTMDEIVGSVKRVGDIIGEITAASGEQSDGIGQVNTAVNQLDQMTQQNAALVEESAAAAQSLRDQATRLAGAVQVFKLRHHSAGAGDYAGDGYGGMPALAAPLADSGPGPALQAPGSRATGGGRVREPAQLH
ncbi:MAG: methyl-accepting chemotaxis protein, partial [Acidovorax sp.]|nr:methyl-accepting chemotaxis protein [Acidovorax sp.]